MSGFLGIFLVDRYVTTFVIVSLSLLHLFSNLALNLSFEGILSRIIKFKVLKATVYSNICSYVLIRNFHLLKYFPFFVIMISLTGFAFTRSQFLFLCEFDTLFKLILHNYCIQHSNFKKINNANFYKVN